MHSESTFRPLAVISLTVFLQACVSTAPNNEQTWRQSRRHKAPRAAHHNDRVKDFTLNGVENATGSTSYYLRPVGADRRRPPLPPFGFTPALDGDNEDVLFPEAPGNIETALKEFLPPVEVFLVTTDSAFVQSGPAPDAPPVRGLNRGDHLAGLVEGGWAKIGKDQFVDLESVVIVSGSKGSRSASVKASVSRSLRTKAVTIPNLGIAPALEPIPEVAPGESP